MLPGVLDTDWCRGLPVIADRRAIDRKSVIADRMSRCERPLPERLCPVRVKIRLSEPESLSELEELDEVSLRIADEQDGAPGLGGLWFADRRHVIRKPS